MSGVLTPVYALKPFDYFKGGHNAREIVIDDPLRELTRSLADQGFLQPVGAVDHGDHGEPLYGFRRLAAYRYGLDEKLPVPGEIPVHLYPPTITPTQRRIITATENLQRQDLTGPQTFQLCHELMDLNPGWTRKDLAMHLNKSPSAVTIYLSPDELIEEARKAFLSGAFDLSKAYAISKSHDQGKALALALNGSSRSGLERENRKQRNGHAKAATVTAKCIPVVLTSGIAMTFKAEGITLDKALDALDEARKLLNAAIKDDHDAKTFAALMKKRARQLARSKKPEPSLASSAS